MAVPKINPDRLLPATASTVGQSLRHGGWDTDLAVRSDDYASIALAAAAAGWATADGGATQVNTRRVVVPDGTSTITAPIAIYDSSFIHLAGERRTVIAPGADLTAMLRLDDCAYAVVESLLFATSAGWDVDDVVRIDAAASAASVRVRDIIIDQFDWVRALSLGLYSAGNDLPYTTAERIDIIGDWTDGNTETCQQGITIGSSTGGNVLNHSIQNATVQGVRYPIVVGLVNTTIRDVHVDTGEAAISGAGWEYLVWDGFRVEDCQKFADFSTFGTNSTPKTFRNGWYVHNLTVTETAANFAQAGDVTFENVFWRSNNYPTTKAKIGGHGSFKPRTITFRNFYARETPTELYYDSGSDDWKYNWWVFDGYHQMDSDTQPLTTLRGLYTRTITAAANVQPYDGILIANTTGGAFAVTLPPAANMGGRHLYIKQTSANAATITPQVGDTVAGGATLVPGNGVTRHLVSNGGTDWTMLS